MVNSDLGDLVSIDNNLVIPLKTLGGQSRRARCPEEKRERLDILKRYKEGLKLLVVGKKASMVTSPITGQWMKSKIPWKIISDMSGNLWKDQEKFNDLNWRSTKI